MAIYGGPRIITNNIVFYMDFANTKCYPGSGTTCFDISSNNHIGELTKSPFTIPPTFTNNKYFSFDGANNAILIPNSTALDTQTPSVEVWIKTNARNQYGFWFEKGAVNTQYSLFQEGATVQWRQILSPGGLSNLTTGIDSSGIDSIDNWYHVVATFTSGSRKLYTNGVLKNSDSQTGTIDTNNGGMSIGAYGGYGNGAGYTYNGNIGMVKVYNKVLTGDEVLTNFLATKGRFGL